MLRQLSLSLVVLASPCAAQTRAAPEIAVGVLAHGVNLTKTASSRIPEGTEERGTTDIELMIRGRPERLLLGGRPSLKAEVNLDGRTSFFSAGSEWRQSFLRGRFYVQGGLGLTYQTGYSFLADPFEPGISQAEFQRRYPTYISRTEFGSKLLFNPNVSLGVKVGRSFALEVALEHYSQARLFSRQNPGINNIGLRLVKLLGG